MIMMRMGGPGNMKMTATAMTMSGLAEMLSRQIGKPVIDQTGITGNYDVDLEFKPEEGMGMMRGMPAPMPRPEGAPAGHEATPKPARRFSPLSRTSLASSWTLRRVRSKPSSWTRQIRPQPRTKGER